MPDKSILKEIEINQRVRFYFWRTQTLPISAKEIARHSANMHLLPANDKVLATLDRVKQGEVVSLSGYLVCATHSNNFVWQTSLTRNDIGVGACELVFVQQVSIPFIPH